MHEAGSSTEFTWPGPARAPGERWWARSLAAACVLLAAYVGLSALCDPRGTLGTDTGGKLATLREMDAHDTWRPDVGYWAAPIDPDGLAHPIFYTERFDEQYVNVTTLPMLVAAKPLYALGGVRAALALPMLGGIAVAFAGRALARRLGSRAPWVAFWLLGLASPVVIYSLDLWEHTLGLAAMAWGVVALVDLADGRRAPLAAGLLAGAAFGGAATLRTEALLYGAVLTAAVLVRVGRRSARAAAAAGLGALSALAAATLGNEMLERVLLGSPLRSGRAAGSATSAGGETSTRLAEGLRTTIGLNYADLAVDVLVGTLIVAALAVAAALAAREARTGKPVARRHLIELVAVAVVLYVVRFRTGLSFVSGMLPATPVAVAGLMVGPRLRHAWLVVWALLCLPAVWALQYVGGAAPQWGGRYVLLSGWILGVAGIVALEVVAPFVRRAFVALAVGVTLYGGAFVVDRTHDGARTFAAIASLDDDIVIARFGHVFREAGDFYTRERRWLTAVDPAAVAKAAAVVDVAHPATLAVITYPDDGAAEFRGYAMTSSEPLRFFSERLEVRHYERVER